MILLLTNDDGINSSGLLTLKKCLEKDHEVWVVAPDGNRSGVSHALTFRGPIKFRKIDERVYSCTGTPADCVFYTLLGTIPVKPDMVIAGTNQGANIGTDILYSGTAAAARQGALSGIPAVAVSAVCDDNIIFEDVQLKYQQQQYPELTGNKIFEYAADFVNSNIQTFFKLWGRDHFININIPKSIENEPAIEITHPSVRSYINKIDTFEAPNGDMYVFLIPESLEAENEDGSDWNAIQAGNISISPVYLHPSNSDEDKVYLKEEFRKPNNERRF